MKRVLNAAGLAGLVFVMGLGSAEAQNIYVTELGDSSGKGGKIYEFTAGGQRAVFADGLENPFSLAFNEKGELLVSEVVQGRILKISQNGSQSVIAEGVGAVSAIVCDSKGTIYASSQDLHARENGRVIKISPGGSPAVLTTLSGHLGLDSNDDLLVAHQNSVFRFAATDEHSSIEPHLAVAGPMTLDVFGNFYTVGPDLLVYHKPPGDVLMPFTSGIKSVIALACDHEGNVFTTDIVSGKVLKIDRRGAISEFATGLKCPRGIAIRKAPPVKISLAGEKAAGPAKDRTEALERTFVPES